MEKIYEANIKKHLFFLLKALSNRPANIMISGGSLLSLLNNSEIKTLKTDNWSIYYADERLTEDENEINYILSKPFLKLIDGRAHRLDSMDMELPKMDLILLGIGGDGHICSLFPNHPLLTSEKEIDIINDSPKPPPKRLTVTLKYLNKHPELYFYLTKEKAELLTEPHQSIQEKLQPKLKIIIEK